MVYRPILLKLQKWLPLRVMVRFRVKDFFKIFLWVLSHKVSYNQKYIMRKKIIFYARTRVEDTYSFFTCFIKRRPGSLFAFGRKILFSFSWYIFMNRPILLKLQKWLPLRVKVRILYCYKKIKIKTFLSKRIPPPKKRYDFRSIDSILWNNVLRVIAFFNVGS